MSQCSTHQKLYFRHIIVNTIFYKLIFLLCSYQNFLEFCFKINNILVVWKCLDNFQNYIERICNNTGDGYQLITPIQPPLFSYTNLPFFSIYVICERSISSLRQQVLNICLASNSYNLFARKKMSVSTQIYLY